MVQENYIQNCADFMQNCQYTNEAKISIVEKQLHNLITSAIYTALNEREPHHKVRTKYIDKKKKYNTYEQQTTPCLQ